MHFSQTDLLLMESNHPEFMREAEKFRLAKLAQGDAEHGRRTLLDLLHMRRHSTGKPTDKAPKHRKAA
jgi:hypothetical protein